MFPIYVEVNTMSSAKALSKAAKYLISWTNIHVCQQCILRSACAFAYFDQGLQCLLSQSSHSIPAFGKGVLTLIKHGTVADLQYLAKSNVAPDILP